MIRVPSSNIQKYKRGEGDKCTGGNDGYAIAIKIPSTTFEITGAYYHNDIKIPLGIDIRKT